MSIYDMTEYRIPEGETYQSCISDLMHKIKAGIDREDNLDALFRLTYPAALVELKKYKYFNTMEELTPYMSIAFMKAVEAFDDTIENKSFVNYYKLTMSHLIIKAHTRTHNGERVLRPHFDDNRTNLEDTIHDNADISYDHIIQNLEPSVESQCLYNEMIELIYDGIEYVFSKEKQSPKLAAFKLLYTEYITAKVIEQPVTNISLAKKYNLDISTTNRHISKYNSVLRHYLKLNGY